MGIDAQMLVKTRMSITPEEVRQVSVAMCEAFGAEQFWLESRISDARIFYGGDSSGVCAEPFGAMERAAIWAHFCRVGHSPYQRSFTVFADPGAVVRCGFCATDMLSTGGGRDRSFYVCVGCGKKVVQLRDGRTIIVPRGKDFFSVRDAEPAA